MRLGHGDLVAASGGDSWTLRCAGPARESCQAWPDYLSDLATIVLRVRLLGGEHTDLTYEDPDHDDEVALVDQVVELMSEQSGVLRCRHGDRLVALFARGVASIEVSPRGAVV